METKAGFGFSRMGGPLTENRHAGGSFAPEKWRGTKLEWDTKSRPASTNSKEADPVI